MSTLVSGSATFQLSGLAGLGYRLGFWIVFTIIVEKNYEKRDCISRERNSIKRCHLAYHVRGN